MNLIDNKLKIIVDQARSDNLDEMTVRILLKESLQSQILFAIYNSKLARDLVFYGGTALRKIYGLDRMSEDLDFETDKKIELSELSKIVLTYFDRLGLDGVEAKTQKSKGVNRITFKFMILNQLGMSLLKSEKLHVKVEINYQPNGGFETELTPLIEDQMSVMIKHYSLSVLMAGKIRACLTRIFKKGKTGITVKGRDYYDLIWYMGQKVKPDDKYQKKSGYKQAEVWAELDEKIKLIKAKDLLLDLQPFFESKRYIREWCDNFHKLYWRYRKFYSII